MNNTEKIRTLTRTAGFVILLLTLCISVFLPATCIALNTKNLVIGGLLSAFGSIIVFYYKKQEKDET